MSTRLGTLALLALAGLTAPAGAQILHVLPSGTYAHDVTPDGRYVVGSAAGGGFLWDWRNEPSPTYITGGNDIVAVSDDGSVLVGCMTDPGTGSEVAARWTAAGGWESLGWLPNALSCPSRSNAYDISGDGQTIVGLSWDGCSGRGFKWTAANGMEELQVVGSGGNRATAISGDGTAIGGFGQTTNRAPAYWNAADLSGALYHPDVVGEVSDFNADASLSVGEMHFGGSFYTAYLRPAGGTAIELGSLSGGSMAANAQCLSDDGSLIVGFDYLSFSRVAWVWDPTNGFTSMDQFISDLGITGAPAMLVNRACSADGNVIVGGAEGANPFSFSGFILEVNSGPWQDLGNGLAGTGGVVPVLEGVGDLTAGAPTSIVLSAAHPSSNAYLVIGFSALNAPFKFGVMVPNTDILLGPFPTSPAGGLELNSVWPAGAPSGVEVYWQEWIQDPGGPVGFSASNGLLSTTP